MSKTEPGWGSLPVLLSAKALSMSALTIAVLYASETGAAQEVSERIVRTLFGSGVPSSSLSLSNISSYDMDKLVEETLVIFVCSTTGDGEPPVSMVSFWKALRYSSLPSDILSHLNYAVFGLGDSSYPKFNVVGKRLFRRLQQLGATAVLERGEGDEQHPFGYDGALEPWIDRLVHAIRRLGYISGPPLTVLPPRAELNFVDTSRMEARLSECHIDRVFLASLVANRRLTSTDHFQDVRHIEFRVPASVSYAPGDVAVLSPQNLACDVQELISLFGWEFDADRPFLLQSQRPDFIVPTSLLSSPTTARTLLEKYLDIHRPPLRHFFAILASLSTFPLHAEKLSELAAKEGMDLYLDYVVRPRRTSIEVVRDFAEGLGNVSVRFIFDLFPLTRGRKFSIASAMPPVVGLDGAGQESGDARVDLCVGMVRYKTILTSLREGMCSRWLNSLCSHDLPVSIPMRICKGTISLASQEERDASRPMILMAAGTGVAPMRSILQHNAHAHRRKTLLFFGCRYLAKDFLYSEEWCSSQYASWLTVFAAGSRDPPPKASTATKSKIYLQHILRQHGALVWKTIHDENAVVCLSGNSKLPKEIDRALVDIFMQEGNMDTADAEGYLEKLKISQRYQAETWS